MAGRAVDTIERTIDATGKFVLPGLIDCQVHLGAVYDDWSSGPLAAAHAGGPCQRALAWDLGHHRHGGGGGAARRPGRARHPEIINLAASMSLANTWTPALEGATVRNAYPGRSGLQGILAVELHRAGFTGLPDASGAPG
jgi:hypothetical protein